jgi:ABC-2 type transport system ATP-binding protein
MNRRDGAVDAAISTSGLTKHYGAVAALDDVTLNVPRGMIYGFLGPNGAGKTTTIKLLLGFVRPTRGSAAIFGHDTTQDGVAARARIGFLVQPDQLYPDMAGDELLDALDLSQRDLRRKLGSYSKGMRQKLALIAALQHDPDLLILDEPTDGLDPLIQRNFEEVLRALRARGRTIFMSSHDLSEIERTCELVAVVRGGRLVAEETVEGLKRLHRRRATIAFRGDAPPVIRSLPGVEVLEHGERGVTLLMDGDVNALIRMLAESEIEDIVIAPPSLDDIFMGFYDRVPVNGAS